MRTPIIRRKSLGLMLTAGIAFATAGCEMLTDPGAPEGRFAINEATTTGEVAPSCPMVPSTIVAEGKQIKAGFSEGACAKLRVCVEPSGWKDLTQSTYIPGIDIVIAFDTTGSMQPYINAMVKNIQNLITNLSGLTPSLRLGLVSFKDFGDRSGTSSDKPYIVNVPLTATTSQVATALGTLKAVGGGDTPESLSTTIKAVIDGKALDPYFGTSDMGFVDDPGRIRIVLGVTDAADRKHNLPAGAPTLAQAAALLKEKGILFMGIGLKKNSSQTWYFANNKWTSTPTGAPGEVVYPDNMSSFGDLAELARESGAVVRAPGLDLDGDGKTTTVGELNAGDAAVLQMSPTGELLGAKAGADSTKVLADAITQMVKRVRPFQFRLDVLAGKRVFAPADNHLTLSPEVNDQRCFTQILFQPLEVTGCPKSAEVAVGVFEETSSSSIGAEHLHGKLEANVSCDPGDSPAPSPTPSAEPSPMPTPEPTPSDLPGDNCVNGTCGGVGV